MIKFDIAPGGTKIENNDGVFPARNISSNEKFALFDATKRWQDMLHIYPKSNNIPVISVYGSDNFNAFAGSDMLVLKGEGGSPGLKMSNLALTLLNIAKEKLWN